MDPMAPARAAVLIWVPCLWVWLGGCSLTLSPEKVATSYIKLVIMKDSVAALDLMEAGCPHLYKTGFRTANRVSGAVVESGDAQVTVSVTINGEIVGSGQERTVSNMLDLVREGEVWVVKCPVPVGRSSQ